VPQLPLEQAYPGVIFRPRTRNWWARLTRVPPECVHLETEHAWMATLIPDTLYLRGKPAAQRQRRRPEVSLCRTCLVEILETELADYAGRVVALEPNADSFSQYFFLAVPDFDAAGLQPAVAESIGQRLAEAGGTCSACMRPATWLWLAREEVASLDEVGLIQRAAGRRLCAAHGAAAFCDALESIPEANLFYVNVPYGEAGAYLWI